MVRYEFVTFSWRGVWKAEWRYGSDVVYLDFAQEAISSHNMFEISIENRTMGSMDVQAILKTNWEPEEESFQCKWAWIRVRVSANELDEETAVVDFG